MTFYKLSYCNSNEQEFYGETYWQDIGKALSYAHDICVNRIITDVVQISHNTKVYLFQSLGTPKMLVMIETLKFDD